MNVTINRHRYSPKRGVGELIDSYLWPSPVVPRSGEIVTVHPDLEPSAKSWTGKVTGVQYVFDRGTNAVLTVLDEST